MIVKIKENRNEIIGGSTQFDKIYTQGLEKKQKIEFSSSQFENFK